MNRILCLTALLITACLSAHAQYAIKGTVIDATTNRPVNGVSVYTNSLSSTQAVTDKNGNFTLQAKDGGEMIHFTAMGYAPAQAAITSNHLMVSITPLFANLDEIIVSGNREVQRRTEVPVAINVLSKTLINDTKATRLDMLLNKVPGVFMADLGNEQHSMAARQPIGTKNLFLYLEDGIPIRTVGDFNHNALIEINGAALERIEVIKGPASSLYGSEAIGGAMNFITPSPSPFLTANIQAEVGSRGYKRTDFNMSNTYKKLGIYVGGYLAHQKQDVAEHNNFKKTALTFKANYSFNNKTKLTAVADYINYKTDQKGGLDSAHFYNKDYVSFYRFTYRKVAAFRWRTTLEKEWNDNNKTSFTLFYRHSAIGQNPFYSIGSITGNPQKAKGQINEDAFKSYGTILQHTKNMDALKTKWISGISIDYSPATYFAQYIDIDKNQDGIYYNYTATDSLLTKYNVDLLNTAAYTQLEFKPMEKLKFVAAARYDRLDYRFDNHLTSGAFTGAPDAKNQFSHFTPKVGLTYNFGKGTGIYLNYSTGFAPPNITDLYSGVQVPVLQPASYNNYEAGGWFSFAKNKGYTEVSLYQLEGKNEIVSVRLADGTYQNQNAGKTSHKGVEANIKYIPFKDVMLRVGGTYAQHKYIQYSQQGKDYSGNTMAQAPRYIINSELTYKPRFITGLRLAVEYQGMGKYFTNAQNTATYKGFSMYNVRAGYSLGQMEWWVNCLNVTNKIYATTVDKSIYGTSYRPGQLRTFNVGVAYHFKKSEQ